MGITRGVLIIGIVLAILLVVPAPVAAEDCETDSLTGIVECTEDTVDETGDDLEDTVDETGDDLEDTVDETEEELKDTVDETKDQVEDSTLLGYLEDTNNELDSEFEDVGVQPVTETGTSIPLPTDVEGEALQKAPVTDPGDVMLLVTETETYLVYFDGDTTISRATIEGAALEEPITLSASNGDTVSVTPVVASDVAFDRSTRSTTVQAVYDDPSSVEHDLVTITAHHRTFPTRVKPRDGTVVSNPVTTGVLVDGSGQDVPFHTTPGADARTLLEASASETSARPASVLEDLLAATDEPRVYTVDEANRFAVRERASVSGVVLPRDGPSRDALRVLGVGDNVPDSAPVIYTTVTESAVDYEEVALQDVAQTDSPDGAKVTVTANAAFGTTSVQETLRSYSKACSGELVDIPSPSGVVCGDVGTDVVAYSGLAWSDDHAADPLFIVGLAAPEQNTPVRTELGQYRLSGELRNAREIDDRFPDANVLFLSDVQKRGDITGDASVVDERRSAVMDVLTSQVTGEDIGIATDQFQVHDTGLDEEPGDQTTDEPADDPNGSDQNGTEGASDGDGSSGDDGTSSSAGGSGDDGTASSDGQTTGDGPGFGIVGAIAGVGWIGYLLRRRSAVV